MPPPKLGTAAGSGEPVLPTEERDAGGQPRTKVSTSPGFSDPSFPSFAGGTHRGRAALGGPTLLDQPAMPAGEVRSAPSTPDEGAGPAGGATPQDRRAASATLMSQSPLRGVFAEFGGMKSAPGRAAAGGSTMLDQPSAETARASRSGPEGRAPQPDAVHLGGPTLLDQPAIIVPAAPVAASVGTPPRELAPAAPAADAPPPLSSEARALLERFAGSGGMPRSAPGGEGQPVAPAAAAEQSNTLRGLSAPQQPAPASVAPAPGPTPSFPAATILGMPVPPGVRRDDEGDAGSGKDSSAKPAAPQTPRPLVPGGGTVLGIPVQPIVFAANVRIETAAPPVDPSSTPKTADRKEPYFFGDETPETAASRASSRSGPSEAPLKPPDSSGMTMFGLPSPARRASQGPELPAQSAPMARPEPGRPSVPGIGEDTGALVIQHKGRGWALVVVALIVVVGVVAVAVGVLLLSGNPYEITPEVTVGGDRVRVVLGITPAAKGARISFVGQVQPVEDGKATFDIRSQVLSVGTNKIPVEILDADGGHSTTSVTFDVSYKAEADMSGLAAVPSYYAVEFQVMKGATLEVASQPVTLDGEGRYVHKIPLSEAAAGAVDAGDSVSHRLPFAVQLPGKEPIREVIDTAIPRTGLRIQAPADQMVVERDTILCAGQTEPTAEVTINGAKVAVADGRFSQPVPLSKVGEHVIEVTAAAPGKASRTVRLTVRRAEDLAPLIQAFAATVDTSLTYERVSRDPEAVHGRPVRFHGRVVALEVAGGQTLMQVLVDEGCAQDGRCSIHVTYRGESDAQLYSRVTVFGTVSGQWQGQTQSGNRLVMPSIGARFVVTEHGSR
jgi:hypothetical protein